MSDTSDISKMKVADLKRELKIRGLPITGNKTELTERLQAAQIDGDLSFDDAAISGEDLLEDDDGVLTDEDEKILDEHELLKSPTSLEKTNPIDTPTVTNAAPVSTQKVVLKRKISTSILNDAVFNASDNTKPTPAKLSKSTEAANEKPVVKPISTCIDATATAAVKKVAELTAQERLEMRAKKFGVSTASACTTVETAAVAKEATITSVEGGEKETEVLKKRAERFGCVVSSKMVQLDAAERLQKRKERFGGAAAPKNTTIAKISTTTPTSTATTGVDIKPTNDVWAEKARLRLERFKSTEAKTVNV